MARTRTPDLSQLIASARTCQDAIVEAEREVLRRRYKLASVFLEIVRAPRLARRSATTLAAHALGLDPTTITRWACLPQWLAEEAFERLIATHRDGGGTLTAAQIRDIGLACAQHRNATMVRLVGSLPPASSGFNVPHLSHLGDEVETE